MSRNPQQGFTLIELMIVIAIIGILASVAVPQYTAYVRKAEFAQLIVSTHARKTAVALCYQESNSFASCNGTRLSTDHQMIPADIPAPGVDAIESVTTAAGVITAVGTADVGGFTYILTPSIAANEIVWTSGGTCKSVRFCR